jgi:ribosomal-protein-alanine N-acetyltransferase
MQILFETERLVLKTLNAEYTETVQSYFAKNEQFFKPYMPTWPENFLNFENIEKVLQEQWFKMHKKQMLHFYIFDVRDRAFQQILGDITFSNIVYGAFQSCFLGYKTNEKSCDKGIATEAVGKACQFVFEDMNLNRIEANIMPQNLASQKVVEKLGFIREGLSFKYLKINGNNEVQCIYIFSIIFDTCFLRSGTGYQN